MRKVLAAIAAITLLSGCAATADAGTPSLTSQKLDKILANTEQIKAKLGIVDPVTPPPVVPPVVVPGPPPVEGDTAAAKFNWGTPLPASDEFNYTGTPDPAKWGLYNGAGHNGNGHRVAARNTVMGTFLRQSGLANGDTAGMASTLNQTGGKWEVRARVIADATTGNPYHAVLITWPQSNAWPQGGEYDFFEVSVGDGHATAFMHHPADTVVQDHFQSGTLDLAQWHNYGLNWDTTAKTLTGYIDGVQWFKVTDASAQAPGPMHLASQLDNLSGGTMQAAHLDTDWTHIYG